MDPIVADPSGRPELWVGLALVASAAAAPWLPRQISVIPVSIAIGALAAFALGGAVIGTLLPQIDAAIVRPGGSAAATIGGALAVVVTGLVLVGFLHGIPRGRVLTAAAGAGRWLLIGGIGGWLGFLILSRLILLVDRDRLPARRLAGARPVSETLVRAEMALLVDVGSAWAKAGVIGRVRGRWRLVAYAAQPTSWGASALRRALVDQLVALGGPAAARWT